MRYEQLERYYKKAVELNHYKKEYLKLQLEVHPGNGKGYEIFMVKRDFREIGSLAHQVEEVQKMQDLVDVDGNIDRLKKMGIQYVIVSEIVEKGALDANLPNIADFYRALPSRSKTLVRFAPLYPIYHSGSIRIQQLL